MAGIPPTSDLLVAQKLAEKKKKKTRLREKASHNDGDL